MYNFRKGNYVEAEPFLTKNIQKIARNFCDNRFLSEMLGLIRRLSLTNPIQEPKNKILLKNGVFNFQTFKMEKFSSKNFFLTSVNLDYDPKARCPKFKKFLREVVGREKINLIFEIFGYCLLRDNHLQKFFIFYGNGANGKSVLINCLISFLGRENTSSIDLQTLLENRFASSDLQGKLLNCSADISNRILKNTSILKSLTGEDQVRAEKKHQNSFFFYPYAKQVFSCNELPQTTDLTDAFFRRLILIIFPNQFLDRKCDPNLIAKITTENELKGVLFEAIRALKRLKSQKSFSFCQKIDEIRQLYIANSDPLGFFCQECLEISPQNSIKKSDLHAFFVDFCNEKGIFATNFNNFCKKIPDYVNVTDYKPKTASGRENHWLGIKLRSGIMGKMSKVSRDIFTYCARGKRYSNSNMLKKPLTLSTQTEDKKSRKIVDDPVFSDVFSKWLADSLSNSEAPLLDWSSKYDLSDIEVELEKAKTKGLVFENPVGHWRKV